MAIYSALEWLTATRYSPTAIPRKAPLRKQHGLNSYNLYYVK